MNMINVKINGVNYSVAEGSTVLEAAKAAHIDIPTLCYLKDINEIGACRLCLVEVAEMRGPVLGPWRMVTACFHSKRYSLATEMGAGRCLVHIIMK